MSRFASDNQRATLQRERPVPAARSDDRLVITESDDDLVVYDSERRHIHQLNYATAVIWSLCDGQRSLQEIVRHGQRDLGPELDESIVRSALRQLDETGLLAGPLDPDLRASAASRREFLKKLAMASAIAAPAIVSVSAPVAATGAASGAGLGEACSESSDCDGSSSQCSGGICCISGDPCAPTPSQWICGAMQYWDANGYPDTAQLEAVCGEEPDPIADSEASARQAAPMAELEAAPVVEEPLAEQQVMAEEGAASTDMVQAPADPITQPPVEVSQPAAQEVPAQQPVDPILQAPPPAPEPPPPPPPAPEPPPPAPEPPPPAPEPPPPEPGSAPAGGEESAAPAG